MESEAELDVIEAIASARGARARIGLRINPDNFGPSRNNFFIGMKIKKMSDKKDYDITGLPQNIQMSFTSFSPDSKKFSFVQTLSDRLDLWIVDNGHGMSSDVINDRWMVIGTDAKELISRYARLAGQANLLFLTDFEDTDCVKDTLELVTE